MDFINEIWMAVLNYMKPQVSETAYRMWLQDLILKNLDGKCAVVECNNQMKYNIVSEQYKEPLEAAFEEVIGFHVTVEITTRDNTPKEEVKPKDTHLLPTEQPGDIHTFDTFIEGYSNKFAYRAAMAVAKDPGGVSSQTNYNPLFIYGPSGLGKTHLLNAIWHEIQDNFPEKRILYVKAESFGNEFVIALQRHTTDDFHDKYRKNIDVLLVDDIQFLAGKESITEEFFHTFSALKDAGKQVVITSDRVPKDIPMITDRLKTRFESGLLADINPPEFETRCAVIKRKAEMLDFDIPQEVVEYIAKNVKNNIRHLESVTKKLQAMQNLFNQKPTIAGAQTVIKDIIEDSQPLPVTIQRVVDEVSRVTGISEEEIYSTKQQAAVTHARKITFYVIREVTGMSYVAIGKEFKKDHSTIMYNVNSIEKAMKKDSRLARQVNDIINNINQHKDNQ